ncbi:MAG TPA: PQQ-binding-like beta-propeller repeat protein, partial [Pyrinomonadaceae bacterium]|nr:PQQ-binding-like beta-propeller repeat protein [Pyrinomonadaceae bacterium]
MFCNKLNMASVSNVLCNTALNKRSMSPAAEGKSMNSRKLFTLLLASLLLSATAAAQDWPQWRGPNRDGNVKGATIPATWPKALKEQWKVNVGVGHASPVVANGKIYVFARQGEEEVLLSLDAATGKELWKSSQPIAYEMHEAATGHGKGPKSTPVIYNGNVYTFGISGVLSCHDASTGKVKWRQEFSKQFPKTSPLFGTAMSPIVDSGLLIAHVGGHDKGALTAFDPETGAVKWVNDLDGPAYSSPIVVTLAGVRQLVNFTQGNVIGVEIASGKLLWQLPAKSRYDENSVSAIAYKDMVIFAREGQGLSAVRLVQSKIKDGLDLEAQEVWNNKENQMYLNSPVLVGNTLFGMSPLKKGQFFAIDADTGKTLWQGAGRMGENAAILNLGGKFLLLLLNDANLVVLPTDAKEYLPAAQYTVAKSPTWAHPV